MIRNMALWFRHDKKFDDTKKKMCVGGEQKANESLTDSEKLLILHLPAKYHNEAV